MVLFPSSPRDTFFIPIFKYGLTPHKHPAGLMRLSLLSHWGGPSGLLHLPSGECSRQHFSHHDPKITLSVPMWSGVSPEQKWTLCPFLRLRHDHEDLVLWAGARRNPRCSGAPNSGAQKFWGFLLYLGAGGTATVLSALQENVAEEKKKQNRLCLN